MSKSRTREEQIHEIYTDEGVTSLFVEIEIDDFRNQLVEAEERGRAELQVENERLREALAQVAGYVGGIASPDATAEFLCLIPEEVRLKVAALSSASEDGRMDRERLDWAEGAPLRDVSLCSHMTVRGDISYSIGGDGIRFASLRAAIDAAMDREGQGDE